MFSIQTRYTLLLAIFVSLVAVSAGATFWGLQEQADDTLVINLAGRQRMLVQQMTRLAVEMNEGEDKRLEIQTTAETFDRTLEALRYGGETNYLPDEIVLVPQTGEKDIQEQLERVAQIWGRYQSELKTIKTATPGEHSFQEALDSLEALSPVLAAETDTAVRLFQLYSKQEIDFLRWVQVIFLAGALLLLGFGTYVMHRAVLQPLKRLSQSARRIGKGDLDTQVARVGSGEVQLLADTMETMRADLQISLKKLLELTETLEERVQNRTQELHALNEVSREISSRLELNSVLQSVTDKARQLLDGQVALLCLLDGNSRILSLQSASGAQDAVRRTSTEIENPYVQEIVGQSCPVAYDTRNCQGNCGIMANSYRASHLAVPLKVENRIIGALCVGSKISDNFQEEASGLLSSLGSAAGVAIENARLYAQAERVATLEERQRLAAEMHDGVAQMISYLGIMIDQAEEMIEGGQVQQTVERLQEVREGIDQTCQEVRRSISNLRDEGPVAQSLQEQLAGLAAELSGQGKTPIEWLPRNCPIPLYVPTDEAKLVVGIAREALVNAQRHAQASQISLRLEVKNGQAEMAAVDNGVGFDQGKPLEDGREHFGLDILRARASRLEGALQIESTPGIGTCVRVSWPVRKIQKRT